jgi:predicted ferric reductase
MLSIIKKGVDIPSLAVGAAGLGMGLVLGSSLFVVEASLKSMTSWGTIFAMTGTYLCLLMLILSSRSPFLEKEIGHDKMILWHRNIAPYALILIFAHVFFTTLGYAKPIKQTFWSQTQIFFSEYPWMPEAIAAFLIMMILGVMSYRFIRNKMRYEIWWTLHLFFYVAVVLAFGHQLDNGNIFIKHSFIRACWIIFYVLIFIAIIANRFIQPFIFSRRHKLEIKRVVQETSDVYSVYITGDRLGDIDARGGQFFQWRFLTRKWWWQAHPYSLSRSPLSGDLRITVKILGDHSHDLARRLKPGTKIFAEGPYGIFTSRRRETNLIAAFAAGVGITPILAVLEELPYRAEVTLIYRVPTFDDIIFGDELDYLFLREGWTLYYLIGNRSEHPMTADYIRQYVPDISFRDVFVCGSESFMDDVITLALNAGVMDNRIYHESFSF